MQVYGKNDGTTIPGIKVTVPTIWANTAGNNPSVQGEPSNVQLQDLGTFTNPAKVAYNYGILSRHLINLASTPSNVVLRIQDCNCDCTIYVDVMWNGGGYNI